VFLPIDPVFDAHPELLRTIFRNPDSRSARFECSQWLQSQGSALAELFDKGHLKNQVIGKLGIDLTAWHIWYFGNDHHWLYSFPFENSFYAYHSSNFYIRPKSKPPTHIFNRVWQQVLLENVPPPVLLMALVMCLL
jgi:hypothetical protein